MSTEPDRSRVVWQYAAGSSRAAWEKHVRARTGRGVLGTLAAFLILLVTLVVALLVAVVAAVVMIPLALIGGVVAAVTRLLGGRHGSESPGLPGGRGRRNVRVVTSSADPGH
ncbi:MAG: hypothetical protein AAGI30_01580 [Planctomycetota bacterium]